MDPSASTRTTDCALAIAVPLERGAFLEQLDQESPREFAKWYRIDHGGRDIDADALWAGAYEPHEARPMRRVADEGESIGVEVARACTLRDLASLAARRPVVILAAHWRSGLLQSSDIRDRPAFLDRLRRERSGVLAALRGELAAAAPAVPPVDALLEGAEEGRLAPLLDAIKLVMTRGRLLPPNGAGREAPSHASYYLAINREALDDACPAELGPGAGLELCGETVAAEDVAACFGGTFEGFIDMAVCNSYLLAEAIKRRNPNCLIMANREPTSPTARLLIAREVLRSLHAAPQSYVQLAITLRERLRRGMVRS